MIKAKFAEHIASFRRHGKFKLRDIIREESRDCECCGHKRLKNVYVVYTDGLEFKIGCECWKEIESQQWREELAILDEIYFCHICGKAQRRGGNPLLAYEKRLCWQHYKEYTDEIKEGK